MGSGVGQQIDSVRELGEDEILLQRPYAQKRNIAMTRRKTLMTTFLLMIWQDELTMSHLEKCSLKVLEAQCGKLTARLKFHPPHAVGCFSIARQSEKCLR